MRIDGETLIGWGVKPGPWFPDAIRAARAIIAAGGYEGAAREAALAEVPAGAPVMPLRASGAAFHLNIDPEGAHEIDNVAKVSAHMAELMRLPTVVAGAVMPDACPAGSEPGTIPVGGVAATREAIHPGMHSADICCSMGATYFGKGADPKAILDAAMNLTHFGPGGRPSGQQIAPPPWIMTNFESNPFLNRGMPDAIEHFASQGDGNHFLFVGVSKCTSGPVLVTHHGSRKPGANLYKAGMAVAERYRKGLSPETPKHNAWIPSETGDGEAYWNALQIIRDWTEASHFAIHDLIAGALDLFRLDRVWNEHNFVFRKSDGLFYHAKGATPAWRSFGPALIPMNMAEPILLTRGKGASNALEFSPHGAGRNFSRTAYLKTQAGRTHEELTAEQAAGIDVRWFSGIPDPSELPGAYKNAASMRRQIDKYGLAELLDEIMPYGSIMAGDWQWDAPWKKKRADKPPPL